MGSRECFSRAVILPHIRLATWANISTNYAELDE